MEFDRVVFSAHAVRRMFERGIAKSEVVEVLRSGQVIADYPADQPFPSSLLLGGTAARPLHIVASLDATTRSCVVITVYVPDPEQWNPGFASRRSP